jgi:hypothetical protein
VSIFDTLIIINNNYTTLHKMPKDIIKSVLIIGSGPIVIGQAEFDYDHNQHVLFVKKELRSS